MNDNDKLVVDIYPSKTYLTLSILVYLLVLFASWFYSYTLFLSLILSIVLFIHFLYFYKNTINITQKKLILDDKIIVINNKEYHDFKVTYQSTFLLILNFGTKFVVIFKDALADNSLSELNMRINLCAVQK